MRASPLVLSGMLAVGLGAAASAQWRKLPQYVAGPVSGFELDCKEAKQPFSASAFVTEFDLDGDGKLDHILDVAKGCEANRLLYCNAEGCTISVYLSSTSGQEASHKVRAFKPVREGGKASLLLTMSGTACGTAGACEKRLVWTGAEFVLR